MNWALCDALEPDVVILDREENTLPMAESCPYSWHATHVTSVDTVGAEFETLASVVQSDALAQLSADWQTLASAPDLDFRGWQAVPAVLDQIGSKKSGFKRIEYMIWQKPWMAVGQQTFIASVLKKTGFGAYLAEHDKPYPELIDSALPDPDTFYLFSSEPFPFGRHVDALSEAGFNGVLVDGEFFSWFGSRSHRLLKNFMEANAS